VRSIFSMYHYTGRHFPWIAYTHGCLIFWDYAPCCYVMAIQYPQFNVGTTDAFQRTLRKIPESQINLPSIKLYRQIFLKPENRHTFAAAWIYATFQRTATTIKLRAKQCQCFFFAFFPNLNSDNESIFQRFNPGILALKIGKTWYIPIILFFYS